MLKLKLQFFGHLMGRTNSLEKTLMPGKTEGGKRRGQQRMRRLDGTDSMDMSLSKLREEGQKSLECCSPWDHKKSDMTWLLNSKPMASGNTKVNKLIADN